MKREDREKLVVTWIKFHEAPDESRWKEKLSWADDELCLLTGTNPQLAWEIVLQILNSEPKRKVVADLAAGPVEDLLTEHGRRFIGRFEKQAEKHELFGEMLGAVWKNDELDPEIWKRIVAVAGSPW